MIKVFILAFVMDQVKNRQIDINEELVLKSSDKVGGSGILSGYQTGSRVSLKEILRLMIVESDNTATNIIIDRFGIMAINSYFDKNGYKDTSLQRKMMDFAAIKNGKDNYSSVSDLGSIFLRLYHHQCVDPYYDEIMLNFLKAQTDKSCIPAAVPEAIVAHKTGALTGLYDDGGIIYNNGNDTVLVIMTENYTGEQNAITHMKRFIKAVTK